MGSGRSRLGLPHHRGQGVAFREQGIVPRKLPRGGHVRVRAAGQIGPSERAKASSGGMAQELPELFFFGRCEGGQGCADLGVVGGFSMRTDAVDQLRIHSGRVLRHGAAHLHENASTSQLEYLREPTARLDAC